MNVESLYSDPALEVKTASERIRREFEASAEAEVVHSRRTALADTVVASAFESILAPAYRSGLAVLAVGGYGRRELFPHSDIDLLLLVSDSPDGIRKQALSRFLQVLWDSGLRISHSVRTVRECCELHEGNIELNISLLDQRHLCGDPALYADLCARLPKFIQAQRTDLSRHMCRLAHQRHARFHNTIYHLEPNIKEAPGGLRDVHLIHWLGQLWDAGLESDPALGEARARLDRLRCFLHYRSNRDDNLLSFDAQEEFAADPARFMREYFRGARVIQRTALRVMEGFESKGNSLLAGFRDWRSRLSNSDFTVSRDRVLFRSSRQLEQDPDCALRLFEFVGRHRVALHGETERRLAGRLPQLAEHFQSNPCWPAFHQVLLQPHASAALRAMHDTGVLKAILPEWGEIESYVVRDFNHRYTVDEHTLIAIENLELLREDKDPATERFRILLSEVEDPALLRLALLLHDTGKGEEGESHCERSAAKAEAAASRLGIPTHDAELLRELVRGHLDLSSAMTGRDLADPATALWLAGRVATIERLKMLTLLTYADTSAVHPTALSPWRMSQLWRVYSVTQRELTRELEDDRISEPGAGGLSPEQLGFLKGFPTRYLRIHTPEEIRHHLALEEQRAVAGVCVDIRRSGGVYHLTVLAKDRFYLFASIAGALAGFGMNILKAEAFANQQGTVLDTFVFSDPQRNLELNPPEMDRLRQTLERVLAGRTDVRTLLKNRPKATAPSKGSRITGRVAFDSTASETATLIEVVAQDRPGLLYDLTSTLSEAGCNIEVVLIDTEAHKALDVFYVTANGRKLDPAGEHLLREKLLAVCV